MHPTLQLVFDRFPTHNICVVGSAVLDYEHAKDIDILFLPPTDWKALVKRLGVKYNGWDTPTGHIRRAAWRMDGVEKLIHVMMKDTVKDASDWPNLVLLRSGTVIHRENPFVKDTKRVDT